MEPSRLSRRALAALVVMLGPPRPAGAASHFFTTSDGVSLHYTEDGDARRSALVFVPGWTMPGWVFAPQVAHFAPGHRVLALDPRGQGRSQVAARGYEPVRRGQDIAELLSHARVDRAVLVGWSLGVLDILSYVRAHGDSRIAALVLIDNSIGEGPPPAQANGQFLRNLRTARESTQRGFNAAMFSRTPDAEWLERLHRATLRTPTEAAVQLLSYPVPRTEWRAAVHRVRGPVLYVVRPRFAVQAEALAAGKPNAVTHVYEGAGHALFVDEAERFNADLAAFLRRVGG